jgi:hypothetical protein
MYRNVDKVQYKTPPSQRSTHLNPISVGVSVGVKALVPGCEQRARNRSRPAYTPR